MDNSPPPARYRELTDAFVAQLKATCAVMPEDKKQALILELFAQDLQNALDVAMAEKQQALVWFVEGLWDKYRVTLRDVRTERAAAEEKLQDFLNQQAYTA